MDERSQALRSLISTTLKRNTPGNARGAGAAGRGPAFQNRLRPPPQESRTFGRSAGTPPKKPCRRCRIAPEPRVLDHDRFGPGRSDRRAVYPARRESAAPKKSEGESSVSSKNLERDHALAVRRRTRGVPQRKRQLGRRGGSDGESRKANDETGSEGQASG